jgi:uncharacterized protein (TIGR03083 family)
VTVLPKSDVLTALFASWDDIAAVMADVAEDRWRLPSPLPGWTVHNVVAHMVGTESMLSGESTPESHDVDGLAHVRNEIGALNEAWVRALEPLSGAELLERFRTVTASRRAVLAAMPEEDWNAVGFTPAGPDSYGRFMRIRTFDCWLHGLDIRDALNAPAADADLDGPAARMALDEMVPSMGFVVGKKAGAPEGSRVAIELTGPLARTIRVAVDGRAAVVDDFGDLDPTTVIRLDALDFVRLCGGRAPSASEPPVAFTGDAELGRRVVAHLNYVI